MAHNKLILDFVGNLFECRTISYKDFQDFKNGKDCPLVDSIVEAFTRTINDNNIDVDIITQEPDELED